MNIYKSLCLLSAVILVLTSCTKEKSAEPDSAAISKTELLGEWNFVGMAAYTKSTSSATVAGKTTSNVVITDYTTIENKGTLLISADQVISNDLTNTIDTVMVAQQYINGVLKEEFKIPFNFTAPAASNTAHYTWVGTDSLYFSQGMITMPGNMPSVTSGAKIARAGDTLLLRGTYYDKRTEDEGGLKVLNETQAIMVLKYKRR